MTESHNMKIPGFTGAASLYRPTETYRLAARQEQRPAVVPAAMRPPSVAVGGWTCGDLCESCAVLCALCPTL